MWAVSGDQIFHRDAQGWSRFADEDWRNHLKLLLPFGQPMDLVRVRAGSPNNVWVAATAHMLHWDGQGWTAGSLDEFGYPDVGETAGYNYSDFWIDGPDDVWIAGGVDQVGNTLESGIVHHFEGVGFTRMAVGAYNVYAIWRGGPGLLWAVNSSLSSMPISRLEGTTAQGVVIAGTDPNASAPQLTTLWGRGANDIWATGDTVAHFDGQQWSLVADAPVPTRTASGFFDVVVTGDAGSVWLTSPGPHFFRMVQVK